MVPGLVSAWTEPIVLWTSVIVSACWNQAAVSLNPKMWVGQYQAGIKCVCPVSYHRIVAGTLDSTTGVQARTIKGRDGHVVTGTHITVKPVYRRGNHVITGI